MAICLSAGHSLADSGAIGINGRMENKETMRLRNAIVFCLQSKGLSVTTDKDSESLAEYLARIHPAPEDKVIELHFDCSNGQASGSTAFVKQGASGQCIRLAKDLVDAASQTLNIPNRGVKTELESNRHYLALLHASEMAVIIEVCFIDNEIDMLNYDKYFERLAVKLASILIL